MPEAEIVALAAAGRKTWLVESIGRRLAEELALRRPGLRSLRRITRAEHTREGKVRLVTLVQHQYRRRPGPLPRRAVFSDATGSPHLLGIAFGGLEVHEIEAEQPYVRVAQVVDGRRRFGKRALTVGARAAGYHGAILGHVRELAAKGRTGVLVTHKDAKALVLAEGEVPGWRTAHFNRLRGTNDFEGVDVVLVVGQPYPPVWATERMASALLYDSETPLALLPPRPAAEAGRFVGYPVAEAPVPLRRGGTTVNMTAPRHPDPAVEALRWLAGAAEVVQAVGRGRGVRRTAAGPLEVVLVTPEPTVAADVIETVHQRFRFGGGNGTGSGGVARLVEAARRLGLWLPLVPEWLVEACPGVWSSAGMALKDLHAHLGVGNNLPVPLSILSRTGKFLWAFRLPGRKGRDSRLLAPSSDPVAVLAWLEDGFGEIARLELVGNAEPAEADGPPAAETGAEPPEGVVTRWYEVEAGLEPEWHEAPPDDPEHPAALVPRAVKG